MVQTFANLRRLDPGFDAENVLLFRIDPGHAGYDGQRLVAFYDHMRSAIEAIPGVRSAAFSDFALVSYYFSSGNIEIPGREKNPSENRRVAVLVVSEDFFRTMSIPLLLGREFSTADTATAPPVAVVNETFARRYFPGQHSTGQMFLMQDGPGRVFHIVGVCRDAKYDQMRTDVPPLIYLSQRQRATDGVCFEVRSALPPLALVPAVRKALAVLDFDLPLSGIKTQEQQIEQSIAAERVFASLGSTMGLLAVLLSCIGLYGLMAHNVVRRTGEIGVRMALGATPWQIAAPILREAAVLTTIGLAAGVPVALTLARLIKSQLYGVAPTDLTTLIGSSLLLITVGIVSAWIPARRAMGINLTEALRYE
jgi:predicted permease